MNVHDSEKMLGILCKKGYVNIDRPEYADLIIFNTCAIRGKAEQKFYSQLGRIRQLKKNRSDLKVAVAGCVAQDVKTGLFKKAPFVDFVLGPQNIHLIHNLVSNDSRLALLEDNQEIATQEFEAQRQSGIKAWVSIIFGCDNFCTYCIVPFTRGREVSRSSDRILSEIRELHGKGYKDVTLLGQNVNSYRSDIDFAELLRRIDSIGIERVRFVTSHPRDLSGELITVISQLPSVCEHIHLPLQSASDRILRFMNRRYTYEEYIGKIKMLRDNIPEIAITADVIVGFPGETEADHLDTVRGLKEIEFDGIFAFKFSPRKGTKAFAMQDQVTDDIKSNRLYNILRIQEEITYNKNKKLEGTIQDILVEGPSETDLGMLVGRTRTNKIVTMPNSGESEGSLIKVRVEKAHPHSLFGINISLKSKPV
jgi:tRNA-2-methylthio-N6-dimethylallyladenosine synthase